MASSSPIEKEQAPPADARYSSPRPSDLDTVASSQTTETDASSVGKESSVSLETLVKSRIPELSLWRLLAAHFGYDA